jgi:lambda family phage minor tail protein L
MSMSIQSEIQSLSPSALIELFTLDLSLQSGPILHFHAGTNGMQSDLIWQGLTYTRFPVQAEGFKQSTTGSLPRPTLTASNINGYLAALARAYSGFAGCKLTRTRTFARFLDAVNFSAGNPQADPAQHLPPEIWFVDRKASEDGQSMAFELASSLDMVAVRLPRRQYIQNCCTWLYRSADCGYSGGPVADAGGNATANPALDACGKQLSDCKLRFGATAVLPFGGFPGCGLTT